MGDGIGKQYGPDIYEGGRDERRESSDTYWPAHDPMGDGPPGPPPPKRGGSAGGYHSSSLPPHDAYGPPQPLQPSYHSHGFSDGYGGPPPPVPPSMYGSSASVPVGRAYDPYPPEPAPQPPSHGSSLYSSPGRQNPDVWWSHSSPPPARAPGRPAPQECIIIFDWDDTLMCSSAINAGQFHPHQMVQLESLLEQVLGLSMQLGETLVVTNADDLWVLESTRRFAPRVLPILSRLTIMSARRKYEQTCPGDVFAWKRETFREILATRSLVSSNAGVNLVVLGDSPAEIEAAHTATMGTQSTVKTVKFKETPSGDEVLEQLRMVLKDLPQIVDDSQSGQRNLAQWLRAAPLAASASYGYGGLSTAPLAVGTSYNLSTIPGPSYGYTNLGTTSALGGTGLYAAAHGG